jgi:zinc protease
MNKTIITLLLLITCATSSFSQILPYPISKKSLANGLQVVTIPYESPGVAAFYIVVRVGSREEVEPGKTGFAHFFEHMMFRGTEKYSKEKYSEALKSTGASANANTSFDRTVYHMTGNASYLEKMFELEADRFMNLKYSVQDFKTEAGAVKGEYTKNNANPHSRLYEAVNNTAFDVHTYKHTTMGFFEDIVDMPNQYDFSLEFFDKFYRPEYCTILVVGDVKHDRVVALAEKYFGTWKRGTHVTDIPTEPEQTATRYTHLTVPQFPPQLELKYKGPAFFLSGDVNDYHALSLLAQMLFSEPSELYQKLVVRDQVARNLSGSIFPTRDPYLFSASVTLAKGEAMASVKKQIEDAIEKVKTGPVDAKRLQETKERIRYSFALSMDSPDAIANAVSMYIWLTGDPDGLNRSFQMFESVTAEDIQRVAKIYLTPKRLTIATISPEEKPELE